MSDRAEYIELKGSRKEKGHVDDKKAEANVLVRDWSIEEENMIKRKVDLRMYPMLAIVFGLSFLDRTNISFAFTAGMGKDLKLVVGDRYNIALLVFFAPYFIFELPSNYIIRRIGARWWLSFLIVAWGASVLGMGFVQNWETLTGLRVLLGLFEAGLLPGAIFIIGCWYRPYEMAKRVVGFFMLAGLFMAFGPIMAYGFTQIKVGDGMYAHGWRWLFICEGLMTIVAGFIAPFFLIEFPERARFLNDRQRHIAVERIRIDQQGTKIVHPTWKETFIMLIDWKIMLYCVQYFICASSVYSLAFFGPIILREGMGFSVAKSQLLLAPPSIFTIFAGILAAWFSDKVKLRWPVMVFQAAVGIVGLVIMRYATPPGWRYFGLFIATYGTQSNIPFTLSYVQNQTGRYEKKGISAAAVVSAGAIGGICGSTIFRHEDAPNYTQGIWATIGMLFVYIFVTSFLSWFFTGQNWRADQGIVEKLEKVKGFRYAP
ncbi:MFS transporter prlL [Pseudocercospora fuligena]|uniref:MFS transporter prlL n=1 Tax=Pseudocercospora fuligena TaxID=685502 RepID=A0A8H6VJW1_9PEZI|nr:MFS transporter prlL [Pseudocercospora fuligena]